MKPKKDILQLLLDRLEKYEKEEFVFSKKNLFFNDSLDNISHLVAGVLQIDLSNEKTWNVNKWIDDCLMTDVLLDKGRYFIKGVMIWGMHDTTKQWTDPFCFKLTSNKETKTINYTFALGDLYMDEVLYEIFSSDRSCWDSFLSNVTLESKMGKDVWKYILSASLDYS